MPPKCRFTKEEVVQAALGLAREGGIEAVTARAVGARLHSSPKVIFSLFPGMELLQGEVMKAADALYQSYLARDMAGGKYPPYKASGMAYIRFAREERALFRLLFMRDRSGEQVGSDADAVAPLIALIRKNTGLTQEEAELFHLEMWIFVHGVAAMLATSYCEWDEELTSRMLTDSYMGLKQRFCGKDEKLERN